MAGVFSDLYDSEFLEYVDSLDPIRVIHTPTGTSMQVYLKNAEHIVFDDDRGLITMTPTLNYGEMPVTYTASWSKPAYIWGIHRHLKDKLYESAASRAAIMARNDSVSTFTKAEVMRWHND